MNPQTGWIFASRTIFDLTIIYDDKSSSNNVHNAKQYIETHNQMTSGKHRILERHNESYAWSIGNTNISVLLSTVVTGRRGAGELKSIKFSSTLCSAIESRLINWLSIDIKLTRSSICASWTERRPAESLESEKTRSHQL